MTRPSATPRLVLALATAAAFTTGCAQNPRQADWDGAVQTFTEVLRAVTAISPLRAGPSNRDLAPLAGAGSRTTSGGSAKNDCPTPGGPAKWPQGGRCGDIVW